MNRILASAALLVTATALVSPVVASERGDDSRNAITFAVYGDAPYGCKAPTTAAAPDECPLNSIYHPDTPDGPNPGDPRQVRTTPAFIQAVNKDPKVSLVLHVGDIHSGSGYCYLAYNQTVLDLWSQYKAPLIYTPGDNEWTDCQKSKEGGGVKNSAGQYVDYAAGHPVANLALVRSMFFPVPGQSLGGKKKYVTSQAQAFDPAHPSDAEYVENVMWEDSGVLFVTLNLPGGSNNDDDLWNTGAFGAVRSAPQIQEVAQRDAANMRWLDAAFLLAAAHGDVAVQISEQADMWDLDGTALAAGHIANYKPYITKIQQLTQAFGKPVLLINGDSHHYRSDNPLMPKSNCAFEVGNGTTNTGPCPDDAYDNQTVVSTGQPNFHRLVVHGSSFPLEYVRLTINPKANYENGLTSFGPFSWQRVIPAIAIVP